MIAQQRPTIVKQQSMPTEGRWGLCSTVSLTHTARRSPWGCTRSLYVQAAYRERKAIPSEGSSCEIWRYQWTGR